MVSWRRALAVAGGITCVGVLANELFYPYNNREPVHLGLHRRPRGDLVIGLFILVNVRDSLRVRAGAGTSGAVAAGRGDGAGGIIWMRF